MGDREQDHELIRRFIQTRGVQRAPVGHMAAVLDQPHNGDFSRNVKQSAGLCEAELSVFGF